MVDAGRTSQDGTFVRQSKTRRVSVFPEPGGAGYLQILGVGAWASYLICRVTADRSTDSSALQYLKAMIASLVEGDGADGERLSAQRAESAGGGDCLPSAAGAANCVYCMQPRIETGQSATFAWNPCAARMRPLQSTHVATTCTQSATLEAKVELTQM